ncbi:MAG TPA: phosphomannomutase [Arsenicitalea sp.]|nr:phosphomannomutase [Arsenicitalea sp.]
MADSLKFGTSGLRGLAVDLIGAASARYTLAFINALRIAPGASMLVGQDLRESSPAIAQSVMAAIASAGLRPLDCGALPTPALALDAQTRGLAAIMVTGSHIPADRNGLKFYTARGEIDKAEEAAILESLQGVPGVGLPEITAELSPQTGFSYLARYRQFLPPNALKGQRIGVFQHSSVARDALVTLLESFGAEVLTLGRSEHFIPIDTEALGERDIAQASDWVRNLGLAALVSTDGDADRPLLADDTGAFIRGDVVGILTAKYLGADVVVTPVTSNSSIESTGYFARTLRTKVGSPFVIAGISAARVTGGKVVVGFEANGGVLLGSNVEVNGADIVALPTRDAVLPILAVLGAARAEGLALSQLVATLPPRFARSDRLEHVPFERSAALIRNLGDPTFAGHFLAEAGQVDEVSDIDGLRFVLRCGDVVHYRPSGNAPELRCYTEASSAERAEELLRWGLRAAEAVVR